jgi:hypothetical protein
MAEEEKESKKKIGAIIVGPYTKLVFECAVCKKIYKDPGMCEACNVILKPRGE